LAFNAAASRFLRARMMGETGFFVMVGHFQHEGLRNARTCGIASPRNGISCCSSVVEHIIGNDEVGSSILPSSTSLSQAISVTY
jgi:hypothetical protein